LAGLTLKHEHLQNKKINHIEIKPITANKKHYRLRNQYIGLTIIRNGKTLMKNQ